MYCPICQSVINGTDVFCPRCKNKIPRCPTCKKVIYEKSRFCMDDGTELPDDVIAVFSLSPNNESEISQDAVSIKSENKVQTTQQKRIFIGLILLLLIAVSAFLGHILLSKNDNDEDLLQGSTGSDISEVVLSSESESTQPTPMENPFTDVDQSEKYAQYVLWAVEKGITSGMKAHKFYPNKGCTRGQLLTFLWRASGSPEPKSTESPFVDVQVDSYYYKAALWAAENGIVAGTGKGKLSPDDPCSRGQAALFIWRAHGSPSPTSTANPFKDLDEHSYYYIAVLWSVEQGIANGIGKGKFVPETVCTRSQAVTFLYRAFEETDP